MSLIKPKIFVEVKTWKKCDEILTEPKIITLEEDIEKVIDTTLEKTYENITKFWSGKFTSTIYPKMVLICVETEEFFIYFF